MVRPNSLRVCSRRLMLDGIPDEDDMYRLYLNHSSRLSGGLSFDGFVLGGRKPQLRMLPVSAIAKPPQPIRGLTTFIQLSTVMVVPTAQSHQAIFCLSIKVSNWA
nr:putative integron gene cassette protein [uncultured bacterium]